MSKQLKTAPAIKRLGQHFIFDRNICKKIVQTCPVDLEGKTVLEIGPGPGYLTQAILSFKPKKLIVIEKDSRFIQNLKIIQKDFPNQLEIIEGDALEFKLSDLFENDQGIIISNLPYNIGTILFIKYLYQISHIQAMVLMFQFEVVERIRAKANTKNYGRLSILSQLTTDIKASFKVSPKVFTPPPKVLSSVISFLPKEKMLDKNTMDNLGKVTSLAFQMRRKILKNSLYPLLDKEELDRGQICDISLMKRAEQITAEDYLRLSKLLGIRNSKIGKTNKNGAPERT